MTDGRPLRIAFLTSERVSAGQPAGGLASYVARMSETLRSLGHEAEVFLLGDDVPASPAPRRSARWDPRRWMSGAMLREARGIATRLEARHAEAPFDLVHATNCAATGLFVRRLESRRHVVRVSSLRELWMSADHVRLGKDVRAACWLERRAARRADSVIAPSAWIVPHLATHWGVRAHVVRPPASLETTPDAAPPPGLPDRYLVHFGQLGPRKGTDLLVEALVRAWRVEPALRMVLMGREVASGFVDAQRHRLGAREDSLLDLGPVPKAALYAIVRDAVATVAPSRVDNLPNSVIESLLLQTPVIGTRESSIDEIVEPGGCGALVDQDDPEDLAAALVAAWRAEASWQPRGWIEPSLLDEMNPRRSAEELLRVAYAPEGAASG